MTSFQDFLQGLLANAGFTTVKVIQFGFNEIAKFQSITVEEAKVPPQENSGSRANLLYNRGHNEEPFADRTMK